MCTSRCWAPSCRSRTTRRRASSPAVSRRAREAMSWSRLSAFAIAVSSSWANLAIRSSVSAGGDCSPAQLAMITPQSRPSTTIGAPTAEPTSTPPHGRAPRSDLALAGSPDPGGPPGAPDHRGHALALVADARPRRQPARVRTAMRDHGHLFVRLVAEQHRRVGAEQLAPSPRPPRRRPRSARPPPATSVATRRSAACSSASTLTRLARLGVRDRGGDQLGELGQPMLRVGRERRPRDATVMVPHSAPSTTIGLASPEQIPSARTGSGIAAADGSSVSKRAARPVAWTAAIT